MSSSESYFNFVESNENWWISSDKSTMKDEGHTTLLVDIYFRDISEEEQQD